MGRAVRGTGVERQHHLVEMNKSKLYTRGCVEDTVLSLMPVSQGILDRASPDMPHIKDKGVNDDPPNLQRLEQ